MHKNATSNIVIVGVGNTLRSDDGLGAFICSQLDQLNIKGVSTLVVHQLNTDIIDELLIYDFVLLVDASLTVDQASLYSLQQNETRAISSSHHMNGAMLQALVLKVYGKTLPIFICAIKGEKFEIGDKLSQSAMSNAHIAVGMIQSWIASIQHPVKSYLSTN